MSEKLEILQKKDLDTRIFKIEPTNINGAVTVALSNNPNNGLSIESDGIFFPKTAATNSTITEIYVSALSGDGNNTGTSRDAPVQTIAQAFNKLKDNPLGVHVTIYLHQDEDYVWSSSDSVYMPIGAWFTMLPYGESVDIAFANTPEWSLAYLYSAEIKRPRIHLKANTSITLASGDITVTPTIYKNSYPLNVVNSFMGLHIESRDVPEGVVDEYGNCGFFGNRFSEHKLRFVGCILESGTKVWLMNLGIRSTVFLQECSINSTFGKKIVSVSCGCKASVLITNSNTATDEAIRDTNGTLHYIGVFDPLLSINELFSILVALATYNNVYL